MTENEAKQLARDIGRAYPMLRIDACGELVKGKSHEIICTDLKRGNQFLVCSRERLDCYRPVSPAKPPAQKSLF